MRHILFDTSAYIDALRRGDPSLMHARGIVDGERLWLSAVVLEELLAGAMGRSTKLVERLGRDFDKVNRLLVPNATDWVATGNVLSKFAAAHGYEAIGRARMTNDALIAMSAARIAVTVLTRNARDFGRLAELRTDFHWRLLT